MRDYDKRHRAPEQLILEPGDEVWVTDRNEPRKIWDLGHIVSSLQQVHLGSIDDT